MDDTVDRLARCFEAVFPNARRSTIESATPNTLVEWDSLANVTLLTIVAEEFGVEVPLERLEALGSFAAILEFVRSSSNG